METLWTERRFLAAFHISPLLSPMDRVPGVGNCSNKLSRGYTIVTAPTGEWTQ